MKTKTNNLNRYMLGILTTLCLCINTSQADEFVRSSLQIPVGDPLRSVFMPKSPATAKGIFISWKYLDSTKKVSTSLNRGSGSLITGQKVSPKGQLIFFSGIYKDSSAGASIDYTISRAPYPAVPADGNYSANWKIDYSFVSNTDAEPLSPIQTIYMGSRTRINGVSTYSDNLDQNDKVSIDRYFLDQDSTFD